MNCYQLLMGEFYPALGEGMIVGSLSINSNGVSDCVVL